jgi:uncharacterized protein YggT (Ycf19 family)
MLTIEYSKTFKNFLYRFSFFEFSFLKFEHFWKIIIIGGKIAKYIVIFLGRILVTWWPKNGTATFTKYLF